MITSKVIKPQSLILQQYVDFFLFLNSSKDTQHTYTTYANNNLCLAIYKSNKDYQNIQGETVIINSNKTFCSILTGHYTKPEIINVNGKLECICINLKMHAIRKLTDIPFHELIHQEEVFERIFGKDAMDTLEKVFATENLYQRAMILTELLLKKIEERKSGLSYIQHSLNLIERQRGNIKVYDLLKHLGVSRTKFFNDFKQDIGQAPKHFIETIRFRTALNFLQQNHRNFSLTELAYHLGYNDQSHFIKSFSKMGGKSPSKFLPNVEIVNDVFVWNT